MHAPPYIYILFIFLVCMGIKRCFPRIINIQRLFITPIIFILMSVRGVFTLFNIVPIDLSLWIIGIGLGMVIGYLHIQNRKVKADHSQQLIQLPGDWSMLILILAVFGFEFFIHYSIDAGREIASRITFKWSSLVVLGAIAGMSVGRTLHYFLKYKKSRSETLVLQN